MKNFEMILAGFGGQGILFKGKYLRLRQCLKTKNFLGYRHTDLKCVAVLQIVTL